jgi:multidrug efflux pump subunit AcrA (membrane-fusion protein)
MGAGIIRRSARNVDTNNHLLSVWIEFESDQAIRYRNLIARITAQLELRPETLAVPKSAVVSEGPRNYVFVQLEPGRFERRHVMLGASDDMHVQVLNGLNEDEVVVVHGVAELQTTFASVR